MSLASVVVVLLLIIGDPEKGCKDWEPQDWERCRRACTDLKEEVSACSEGECYCCTAGECIPLAFIEPGC